MDIQDLGAIGELTSALIITITLIFLVIETRRTKEAMLQNNRVVRQQMRSALQLGMANDERLAQIMHKSSGHLSPQFAEKYEERAASFGLGASEYVSLMNHLRAEFSYYEDQFFTQLPETDRRSVDAQFMGVMRSPVARQFWQQQRQFMHPDFAVHGDQLLERLKSDYAGWLERASKGA